jgi:hypothetical protein
MIFPARKTRDVSLPKGLVHSEVTEYTCTGTFPLFDHTRRERHVEREIYGVRIILICTTGTSIQDDARHLAKVSQVVEEGVCEALLPVFETIAVEEVKVIRLTHLANSAQ